MSYECRLKVFLVPSCLPALLMVPELLPGGGPLNGRRWAGQQLLKLWIALANGSEIPLMAVNLTVITEIEKLLTSWGVTPSLRCQDLLTTELVEECGGLFVPDPSIGLWSLWRDAFSTPASFSLVGQIHTLCTVGAITRLEEISNENIFNWDSLICSSSAGKSVVEDIFANREDRLAFRLRISVDTLRTHRPQLPVIPLPMPVDDIQANLPSRNEARQALDIQNESEVFVWLGRISLHTKSDPAPMYRTLNRIASSRGTTFTLIEIGPDDGDSQSELFNCLRSEFSSIRFIRLGSSSPVTEKHKLQALAAADIGISLVDNLQETFGQSVVELLASGLPVICSNWDGYRDLLMDGIHGFLIPSRWASVACDASVPIGWQHRVGLITYDQAAGALAQLVQLDLESFEVAIITLLNYPNLRLAMGRQAAVWARSNFDINVVARQYQDLNVELNSIRASASQEWCYHQRPPLSLDPVTCFESFSSDGNAKMISEDSSPSRISTNLKSHRHQLWHLLGEVLQQHKHEELIQSLEIKHGLRPFRQ